MPRIEFRTLDGSGQTILASIEVPSIHIFAHSKERTVIQVSPEIVDSEIVDSEIVDSETLKKKVEEENRNHPGVFIRIVDLDKRQEKPGGNLFYKHRTLFPDERTIGEFTSSVVAPEDIEPYIDDTIRDEYDREEQNSPLV